MEADIGQAAGVIWHHLDRSGERTLAALRDETKLGQPLLLLALGWLAREGKIELTRDRRTLKVRLRAEQTA